jgi:hypothetical protein
MSRSAHGLDSGQADDDWRRRGACASVLDPDMWTSVDGVDLAMARYVCLHVCLVLDECRRWAYEHPKLCDRAVYGGLYWRRRPGQLVPEPDPHQPDPRRPFALRRPEIRAGR